MIDLPLLIAFLIAAATVLVLLYMLRMANWRYRLTMDMLVNLANCDPSNIERMRWRADALIRILSK